MIKKIKVMKFYCVQSHLENRKQTFFCAVGKRIIIPSFLRLSASKPHKLRFIKPFFVYFWLLSTGFLPLQFCRELKCISPRCFSFSKFTHGATNSDYFCQNFLQFFIYNLLKSYWINLWSIFITLGSGGTLF